ncbi:MAG: hypothetical protein HYV63_30145 [Candidatus Schekmanbacteria bacterium]|nr:hypothetical protein [Candidatus Schekmanbacteria bacterium]
MPALHPKYSILRLERHKRACLTWGRRLAKVMPFAPWIARYLPLSFETKVQLDALPRPQLAYGMFAAAMQARALGLEAITAAELGVFAGAGLRCMERYAARIEAIPDLHGVRIEVVGFDRGEGLPASDDPRDAPYWFEAGLFRVDIEVVRRSLRRARFLVGDVADTVSDFLALGLPPLGFVSFDLDYYRSTVDALRILAIPDQRLLPRVLCYFDDIFGVSDLTILGPCVGEEAAIGEWNASNPRRPLAPVTGLRHKRPFAAPWNDQYWALHLWDHPLYNVGINPLT